MTAQSSSPICKKTRLLRKIATLSPNVQKYVWGLYRVFRRAVISRDIVINYAHVLERVERTLQTGMPYRCYSLALNLAQLVSKTKLTSQGSNTRVYRPLVIEAFHLIRIQIQVWFNFRTAIELPTKEYGNHHHSNTALQAFCDGSFQAGASRIGILILDKNREAVAEITRRVEESSAFESEMAALKTTLQTLIAINALSAIVHVDSHGLLFQSVSIKNTYKICRSEINQLITEFDYLKIVLVPRLFNFKADRLAADKH